jgi:hypothetical protein
MTEKQQPDLPEPDEGGHTSPHGDQLEEGEPTQEPSPEEEESSEGDS